MKKGTPYNLEGLVGSATITINPAKDGMLKITIFNITSLTSGAFGKEMLGKMLSKIIYEGSW